MKPPITDKQNYSFEVHEATINDDYHWLRDPKWPNVEDSKILDYLKAENQYTENFFADLQNDKEKIFEELKGRVKLDDESVYVKNKDYYYYHRVEENKNYPIYCRKHNNMDSAEEVILDVNLLAPNSGFTDVATVAMSPDHNLMAYSVNFTGNEQYNIKIYNLKEQKYLPDELGNVQLNLDRFRQDEFQEKPAERTNVREHRRMPQNSLVSSDRDLAVAPTIIWHEHLNGFFYITINENQRWNKVMFHRLGEEVTQDKLIFKVKNPLHFISCKKSASHEYIFINSGDHNENEIYVISMQDDSFTPKLVRAAENKIFYEIEYNGDYFYIKTNYKAKNFHVIKLPVNNFENTSWDDWDDIYIKEEQDKYLKSFNVTNNYLILNYRDQGLPLIKIKRFKDLQENTIHFPDESFQASSFSTNFEEDDIRIDYSSLARPNTTYSYDFNSDKLTILKSHEIPSGFNPEEYKVERIFADNEDVKVPITLFYKKSLFKKDGSNPLYLMGYGAYGIAMPVNFRNTAVTLADRGFIYAVAHIRGGDDLGHDWYEAAKFLTKKRTFEDFIACSRTLINEQYTSNNNIVIMGGSAGGMLIGYILNEKPEIYRAAIAHVPFVDVLSTMLDESLPLTLLEYNEWGNPKEKEYFEYIKSYSPYDNVKAQNYPALFVTCGISDPRVGYWEPAKWVAKLRALKMDNNPLLLKTNMDTGHKGSAGRFDYLKEIADELVFIFKVFDVEV
ncbi:prolyl oligopeptidase family serine peptidase [Rickettsia japonica]|uniref:Palindromic element RPE3 domain-containing protein n=3 Tax=spotted fever group TaxID=114277 RepID=A0AAD1CAJ4_RICJA|nr:prolyl oligopeptidase family serine peptidase [Rickettsia japonica]AXU06329.1 palindromic element RPE3 domain-containing protein [Rickettsia japonica]QHE25004.1 prolyl oligopeptidase family serine peptidase [Rickettsia japonica]BAK96516.1 protease II [Rickettsia japonica YH]BAW82589.1 protease II [Rickettsia japonica]